MSTETQQSPGHLSDKTPGQLNYEAYWSAWRPADYPIGWSTLQDGQRHAWEAAAQAVRAMREEESMPLTRTHMARVFRMPDHTLTKADVTALLVAFGGEARRCGCGDRPTWCARCECLQEIAAAAMWLKFTRDEVTTLIDHLRSGAFLDEREDPAHA